MGQNIAGRENLTCASFIGLAFFREILCGRPFLSRACRQSNLRKPRGSRQLGSSKSTLGDGATACAYRRAQRLGPTALIEAGGMAERGRLEALRECMTSGVTVPPWRSRVIWRAGKVGTSQLRRFKHASGMSASLIGHLGSSAFRPSTTTAVSMSLTGSCFSSESAPRPFHHGIRERGGTIYSAALPL